MKRVTIQGGRVTRMAGVTLIELMVVMMIVAILTAIAVPAYRSHIVKTNRRAAESCLSEAAQFMERYYTTKLTYVDAAPSPACQSDANLSVRYTFSTSNLTQNTYTVVATPQGPQSSDTQCGVLSVKQDGTRSPTTSGCW
jgi:type IV pilus assembly protein PilE